MIKEAVSGLAANLVQEGARQGSRMIQIESTRKYVESIRMIRELSLAYFMSQFVLVVAAFSLLVAISGFLFILPFGLELRIGLISTFHFLIFVTTACLFFRLQSEERWLKNTRAKDLVDRALRI